MLRTTKIKLLEFFWNHYNFFIFPLKKFYAIIEKVPVFFNLLINVKNIERLTNKKKENFIIFVLRIIFLPNLAK